MIWIHFTQHRLAASTSFNNSIIFITLIAYGSIKIKKYYNCIFSIECNLRKHGAVTNQSSFNSIQRHWIKRLDWFGWPAVWAPFINHQQFLFHSTLNKPNFFGLVDWVDGRNAELNEQAAPAAPALPFRSLQFNSICRFTSTFIKFHLAHLLRPAGRKNSIKLISLILFHSLLSAGAAG